MNGTRIEGENLIIPLGAIEAMEIKSSLMSEAGVAGVTFYVGNEAFAKVLKEARGLILNGKTGHVSAFYQPDIQKMHSKAG